MVGNYAEIKAQPELTNDMSNQRAKDVVIPPGQSVDTEGHDDLSDQLDKGGLNHLDHYQVIASVDKWGGKDMEDDSGFLRVRTTNRETSIEHRGKEDGQTTYGLDHR